MPAGRRRRARHLVRPTHPHGARVVDDGSGRRRLSDRSNMHDPNHALSSIDVPDKNCDNLPRFARLHDTMTIVKNYPGLCVVYFGCACHMTLSQVGGEEKTLLVSFDRRARNDEQTSLGTYYDTNTTLDEDARTYIVDKAG